MTHSTRAIILRTRHLREADLWVRLATPTGRLSGVANAALKSRKRFPFGFPLGAEVVISYQEGKSPDLVTLQEMSLTHGLLGRESLDYKLLGAVGYALELVDRTWPEHQESADKFDCLATFMTEIAETPKLAERLLEFCWVWLGHLGFSPMMTGCSRCNIPYDRQGNWRILIEAGGLVCPNCRHPNEHGIAPSSHWKQDVVQLWITQVLDLKMNAESWWKLLWKTAED